MGLTGLSFYAFFAILLFAYYLTPRKWRGFILLPAGAVFFVWADPGRPWLLLFPIGSALATFLLARCLIPETGAEKGVLLKRRLLLTAECVLLLGTLGVFKYCGLFGIRRPTGDALPLGISFYTFILLGYFLDVYMGITEAEHRFSDLLTGGLWFPLLVSGPIVRYREIHAEISSPKTISYEHLTMGLQRMLWGIFKKLVISERLGAIVNAVYDPGTEAAGAWIWLGAVSFTLQLYTDFSGCMDIVLGLSETLGIRLPENFRTPFFSESVAEFWRRWHITLGEWLKEHLFYPLLRTGLFTRIGNGLRKCWGKKTGKLCTTWFAMFVLWFTVGLWHGGDWKFVIGTGLLQWFYIVCEECVAQYGKKGKSGGEKRRILSAFRCLRTFLLISVSFIFFRAASTAQAVGLLARAIRFTRPGMTTGVFLENTGMTMIEWGILLLALTVHLIVSTIQFRAESTGEAEPERAVRRRIAGWPLPIRWAIWMLLLFVVILLGRYGPGVDASEFIYRGF